MLTSTSLAILCIAIASLQYIQSFSILKLGINSKKIAVHSKLSPINNINVVRQNLQLFALSDSGSVTNVFWIDIDVNNLEWIINIQNTLSINIKFSYNILQY